MKRFYIYTIIAVLVSAMLGSCSALEEVNPTALTGIYDTEEVLEAGVVGVLRDKIFGSGWERAGAASGVMTWGVTGSSYYNQNDYTHCMNFALLYTGADNRYIFQAQYKAIQRANLLIANLPSSPVNESYKLEIEAECRLYRAMAYLNLVRYYGDVPLRLTPPVAEDATKFPCSPYYEVYKQVIRDLEFAEQNMRSPERARKISPKDFRPNKYAATAFLSTVYTHIGSLLAHSSDNFWDSSKPGRVPDFESLGIKNAADAYRKALAYAEKLIPESTSHDENCPYALVEKISDLFQFTSTFSRNGYTSWNNPEQIMVSSFSIESGSAVYITRGTVPNYCPGSMQTENSNNTARIRPSRWFFEKWCSTYPGAMGTGSFAQVHVSSSDPRVAATMWYGPIKLSTGDEITTYPYSTSISRASSMPYFKKYWSARFTGSYSDCDSYHIRLAEVYLNAAEAAAYLGNHDLAKKYIEVIHARARHSVPDGEVDSKQPSWAGRSFSSDDELLRAIFWERMFELCGEGHEFTDTHRFGAKWISEELAKPINAFHALKVNQGLFGKHYAPDISFQEDTLLLRRSLLCPIPQSEVILNSAVTGDKDFSWGI